MVHVYCNFCTHGNPEGSKFCNECGAQLNLAPCSRCDAVNTASARLCFQCGALLSSAFTEWSVPAGWSPAAGELASPSASFEESMPGVESPWIDRGATSVALADLPEPPPAARPFAESGAIHARVDDDARVEAAPLVEPAGHFDERPLEVSPSGRPDYREHNPRRVHGILLAALFAAVAGGGYWLSVNPMRADDQRASTALSSAQERVSSASAAPVPTADTSVDSRDSPARDPLAPPPPAPPVPATPDASVAGREPEPSQDDAAPASVTSAPEPVEARVPVPTPPAPSAVVSIPPRTNARVVADTHRRAVTQVRTREQAERDAIATRRIIARDLADNPRTDPERTAP